MKNAFKTLFQDPLCLWSLTLALIFLILGSICLVFAWPHLPPQVPLFLNRPWGEEQLATKGQLPLLPIFAFLVFLFDLFFSIRFFSKDPILGRTLISTGAILVSILIIALFQIVNLVT